MSAEVARSTGGRPRRARARRTTAPAVPACVARSPVVIESPPDPVQRQADLGREQGHGGEGRCRDPSGLDLAQGLGGDAGASGDVQQGPFAPGPTEHRAEVPAAPDLVGGEGHPDHGPYSNTGIVIPRDVAEEWAVIQVLSQDQVEAARPAGRFVGQVLAELRDRVRPGTNLLEIDGWARELIDRAGAVSCYVNYAPAFGRGPFGKVICTSVNDAVLHGLPHDDRLADGDLLTLDFAVGLHGWVADAAVSFVVGQRVDPADQQMIDTTRAALAAGIGSNPGCCWPSSPGRWPTPTGWSSIPTAGRCAAPPDAAPRIPNTRWPSPTTAR